MDGIWGAAFKKVKTCFTLPVLVLAFSKMVKQVLDKWYRVFKSPAAKILLDKLLRRKIDLTHLRARSITCRSLLFDSVSSCTWQPAKLSASTLVILEPSTSKWLMFSPVKSVTRCIVIRLACGMALSKLIKGLEWGTDRSK